MADVKISALPLATTPLAGTEVLPIVQSATTDQVSVANLTAGRSVSAASLTLTTTPLAVGSGGTGLTSLTAGYIPFGAGTSAFGNSANLFWDNTNTRLGIGTSSPGAKLQVYGTLGQIADFGGTTTTNGYYITVTNAGGAFCFGREASNSGIFGITPYASTVWSNGAYPLVFATNATEHARIDSSGNFLIGTTINTLYNQTSGSGVCYRKGASFDILATSDNTLILNRAGTDGTITEFRKSGTVVGSTFITTTATYFGVNGTYNDWVSSAGTGTVTIGTGNTERMRIDASGNVGIGTSSPGHKLEVANTSAAGYSALRLTSSAKAYDIGVGGASTGTPANAWYVFDATAGAFRLFLDTSGNLLVGDTATVGASIFYSKNTAGTAGRFYNSAASQQSVAALIVDKADNTTTTSQVFVQFTINSQATGSGQINANGANTAAFGTYSDARLKENIVDLPSQLDNVLALRPCEFDYIESEGGGHQIGFIAQEMQEVYPDAVGERDDGMLTITAWSKTEARLVKAFQELAAKVQALEAKVQ